MAPGRVIRRITQCCSLVEVLLTICMIAVVTRVTVPPVTRLLKDVALSNQSFAVVSALTRARQQAIDENRPVAVCGIGRADDAPTSCDGRTLVWQGDWLVYVSAGEPGGSGMSQRRIALSGSALARNIEMHVHLAHRRLVFMPDGSLAHSGEIRIQLYDDRGPEAGRIIRVSGVGRPSVVPALSRS